jgi:GNAT superfamily N-acetyltransferase
MDSVLHDLSTPALVTAIEANLFEFFAAFRRWPQAEVHDEPDMLWTLTSNPFFFVNSVLRAQLTPENADAAIEAAIARCRAKNVSMLWWTGPATTPTNLGAYLTTHGFTCEEMSGMAVDLRSLNSTLSIPPGLAIQQVNDTDTLSQWNRAFATGMGIPDVGADAFLDLWRSLGLDTPALRYYTGRLNGEPVATSQLFLAAGVAGIYAVATVPEARRKGIGAAMTLAPLLEARGMGYRIGILQASPMGASVYRRLGFQECCKIGVHVWTSEGAG